MPANLLLVDDRPENLIALQAILKRPDYRLFTAKSGTEALQLVLRESFTAILLDVLMPGMDGFEVAQHLKQGKTTQHIPILFLTAAATDVRQIFKAYDIGGVDYLIKPLEPDVVRKKVAVLVELAREREQIICEAERRRQSERDEYELQLAELRMANDRLEHLCRDLLAVAQLDAGVVAASRQVVDATLLLEECFAFLRSTADGKRIRLTCQQAEGVELLCDHGRALLIMTKLVLNAIDFTPEGGTVLVRVARAGSEARFELADMTRTTFSFALPLKAAASEPAPQVH